MRMFELEKDFSPDSNTNGKYNQSPTISRCFWYGFYLIIKPVGNIPYDYTEDQIKEIFQEVGPVQSIR